MKLVYLLVLLFAFLSTSGQTGFEMKKVFTDKKVEVWYNGKMLTAYNYFDSTEKPVLFPIRSVSGQTVTRGYPVAPKAGERTDHPHHVGLWFTYESVNGLDFWNNSFAIPREKKNAFGSIRHQKILHSKASENKAQLKTLSRWEDANGKVLLLETTTFNFSVENNDFIIDRHCTLQAINEDVTFQDVKDGLLGFRVARPLEMPSKQEDKFVDAHGNVTDVPVMDNTGVTGMYFTKDGVKGDSVWSSRSAWACLKGKLNNEEISIAIFDHPSNIGYPAYWHARGYGLFAINPLGRKVFTKGKEELNYELEKGKSVAFVYRVVIRSGKEYSTSALDREMKRFHSRKY
jgi:hypothetical protein